ncbi:MAG: hypothetical protein ACRCZY_01835 [Phocaeicola sp.]
MKAIDLKINSNDVNNEAIYQLLKHFKCPTEFCIEAFIENPWLMYVTPIVDEDVYLGVINTHGEALRFIKNQTESICKIAVRANGFALAFVKEQTFDICSIAVKAKRVSIYRPVVTYSRGSFAVFFNNLNEFNKYETDILIHVNEKYKLAFKEYAK